VSSQASGYVREHDSSPGRKKVGLCQQCKNNREIQYARRRNLICVRSISVLTPLMSMQQMQDLM
jgi:hypothetical protein